MAVIEACLGGALALAVAALCASPSVARADEQVAVLDVRAMSPEDDYLARLVTDALRESVREVPGWYPSAREVSIDTGRVLTPECVEAGAACVAHVIGTNLRADWVLFGRLRRVHSDRDDSFTVTLYLWSVQRARFQSTLNEHIQWGEHRTIDTRTDVYVRMLGMLPGRAPPPRPGTAPPLLSGVEMTDSGDDEVLEPPARRSTDRSVRRARRAGWILLAGGGAISLISVFVAALDGDGAEITGIVGLAFGGLGCSAGIGALLGTVRRKPAHAAEATGVLHPRAF